MPTSRSLIDDRLLVADLLARPVVERHSAELFTTTYWYYRALRAASAGGSGQLSGPFAQVSPARQAEAMAALLQLPERVGLPDPRSLVPVMAEIHLRHRQLNLLNVEAAAAGLLLGATVHLSPAAAAGLLPAVLDAEGVRWRREAL